MLKEEKRVKDFRHQLELARQLQQVRQDFSDERTENFRGLRSKRLVENQLEMHGAFLIKDDKEKLGIMIEPEIFKSLLEYVDLLEDQLELNSFEAMAEERKGDDGFVSGERLSVESLDIFDKNKDLIRRYLDGDK